MNKQGTFSKALKKGDDASKALIIEALSGHPTYGFDIDSIYYFETENRWLVMEFLKCDNERVRPSESHPSRYWDKNWRKFASLWRLVNKIGGELILINYEDQEHADRQGRKEREFRIIQVDDMIPTSGGGIVKQRFEDMNFETFRTWFQEVNSRGIRK